MNRLFFPVAVLLVITLAAGTAFARGGGEVALDLPEGFSSASGGGITLQWKVEGENLRVRMAAATMGWVAVGFDPSSRMKDSNIIIGYVGNGQVFLRDDFGTGQTSHGADRDLGGSDDISAADGAEENGQTWLSFAIPLDSGDPYDRALKPGNTYTVNLAAGRNDDFGTYHGTKRAAVSIRL
jgi:hypothetical protein